MKRYLFLLLVVLATAVSCGSEVTETPTGETAGSDASTTTSTPQVDYLETLATDAFAGRTLRIFDANDHPEMHINVALEEQNGDLVNDALYARDRLMEDTFGIEIAYTLSPGATMADAACRQIDQAVLAGDNEWEFAYSCLLGSALSTSAYAGSLYNLIDIEALSLKQEWWSAQLYETLNFNDTMYFTTGDISPSVYQGCNVMFANTKLLNEYNIEDDLMSVALDGKWTLDYLFALTKDTNLDVNADGKLSVQDDFFGLNYHTKVSSLLNGTDVHTVSLNDNKDGFILNFSDEHNVDVTSKIYQNTFKAENKLDNDGPKLMFEEGRSIFFAHAVEVALSHFRDMEDDYIILPMPKSDEQQDNYVSSYSGWISSFVAVPLTADTEFAGTMMEAMAYIGYRDIRPQAYELVYKQKALRDERSGQVLDLAFNNVYLDFNTIFNFGGSNGFLASAASGEAELISSLEGARSATEKAIEDFIASWTQNAT